jgi:CBS domain-containing protein
MPTIRQFMTKDPAVCKVSDTLYDAVRAMQEYNCGAVPIVDANGKCVGIITDRDICLQVVLENNEARKTSLNEVISGEIFACTPDDEIEEVLELMERRQIRRIPVIDTEDRCIGIVSQADIARKAPPEKTGELVGAVSR